MIQGYSILAMEPHEDRFLFKRHQDLQSHTSLHSVNIWTPLSNGIGLGGMRIYRGSHSGGPIKHDVSDAGHLEIKSADLESEELHTLLDFDIGDVVFFSPYSVHESVANKGSSIRWTMVLTIDDASKTPHLAQSISPYVPSDYVDTRTNEERLKAALPIAK